MHRQTQSNLWTIGQARQRELKLTVGKVLPIKAFIVTEWCPDGSQQARSICGLDSLTTSISFPSMGLFRLCLYQVETASRCGTSTFLFKNNFLFRQLEVRCEILFAFWRAVKVTLQGAVTQKMFTLSTRGSVFLLLLCVLLGTLFSNNLNNIYTAITY